MRNILTALVLFYIKFWAKVALIVNKPITVGIAGSVGKSSTRNALYAALAGFKKTKVVTGNSETGLPLGILGIEMQNYGILNWLAVVASVPFRIFSTLGFKQMIVEMGIDDPHPPKNMEYLLSIIKPDVAVSLNVTATHTMQFGKLLKNKPEGISEEEFLLEAIAAEDSKIITESFPRAGIYNADDKYLSRVLKDFDKTKLLTFGKEQNNNIVYKDYSVETDGTSFTFGANEQKVTFNFKGSVLPQVYQAVFAPVILAAQVLGMNLNEIKEALEKNFSLPKGRASIFAGIRKTLIIDSSYNASKSSVLAFLELLSELARKDKRETAFLMGDMRELGELVESEHKQVANEINKTVDYLYCVGPLTYEYVIPHINQTKVKMVKWFETSREAANYLEKNIPENTLLLVKGSQNNIFLEEAVKKLLADSQDSGKLCRQNSYWKKIKKRFFEGQVRA